MNAVAALGGVTYAGTPPAEETPDRRPRDRREPSRETDASNAPTANGAVPAPSSP